MSGDMSDWKYYLDHVLHKKKSNQSSLKLITEYTDEI